jgi:peptidoglycan-N-acetylglucosamine deacetylase
MTQELVMTTSWDDGHPLDLRVAEMLRKHGLTGTFYVPFETSHSVLSIKQVRDLARDFEVGAHTVHHVELPTVPDEVAKAEIYECKQRLEEITGIECETFCFPKGRFHRRHLRMIRELEFRGVRTVELLSLGSPVNVTGLAVIPTTVQAHSHGSSCYARNCVRRLQLAKLVDSIRLGGHKRWDLAAMQLLKRACERGGIFHLWGHSWEIEAADEWGALERVLAVMGQIAKRAACLTNSEICRYAC